MTLKKKKTIFVPLFISFDGFRKKRNFYERTYIYVYLKKRKNQFIYTWIKVETGITLCELLRIARTMSAVASPIVVLVYPFRHLTVGPLKPREESKIVTSWSFRGSKDVCTHSLTTSLESSYHLSSSVSRPILGKMSRNCTPATFTPDQSGTRKRETDLNGHGSVSSPAGCVKLESPRNFEIYRKFSVAGFELTLTVPVLADNSGVNRARRYS